MSFDDWSCTRQTQTNKKDRYKQTDSRQTVHNIRNSTRARAHTLIERKRKRKKETHDALWPRIIHHIDVNVGMVIILQQDCNTHAHTATEIRQIHNNEKKKKRDRDRERERKKIKGADISQRELS